MKTKPQPHTPQLPTFWVKNCKIDAVYNNGKNISITLGSVIGKRFEQFDRQFSGLTPVFEYSDDPQANNPIICREILLQENDPDFWQIEFGENLKHRLQNNDAVAILMRFNNDRRDSGCLGFEIIGWCYQHVFGPAYSELGRRIGEVRRKREIRERMAETHRGLPVRLMYEGKIVVTDTLQNLCAWFQNRAWPKGIELRGNDRGNYVKMDLAMLPAPKAIQVVCPEEFERNSMLVEMLESIKHIDQFTGESREDDSAVPKGNPRHNNSRPNRHVRRNSELKQKALVSLASVLGNEKKLEAIPAPAVIPSKIDTKIAKAHQRRRLMPTRNGSIVIS
jgi:hypothetical protein